MANRELVCTCCPMGCDLNVEDKELDGHQQFIVTGNNCKMGASYGVKECTNPTRGVTSYVKVIDGKEATVSVKTDREVPKDKVFDVVRILKNVAVHAPIKIGDIILKNIFDSEVNMVATKNIEKS